MKLFVKTKETTVFVFRFFCTYEKIKKAENFDVFSWFSFLVVKII